MTEFRFTNPRTDIFNEVKFGFALRSSFLTPLPMTKVPLVHTVTFIKTQDYEFTSRTTREKGRLYVNKRLQPSATKGLVLLCHGSLFQDNAEETYKGVFDLLARCLASLGFVVVSMRHSKADNGGSAGARRSFINHLLHIKNHIDFAKFSLKGKPFALLGQSESGLGAALAAKNISDGMFPSLDTNVSAVIGLAPSVQNGLIIDGHADSLLILQGTHDGDTTSGAKSMAAYEAAQSVPLRAFIWIDGANHINFLDNPFSEEDPNPLEQDLNARISHATQRLVTQNYVASFLQWRLLNDDSKRHPFIGDGFFDFASSLNSEVQDDIKAARLLVSPRYASAPSSLCVPAAIVFQDLMQKDGKVISFDNPAKFQSLGSLDFTLAPQTTDGFRILWKKANFPKPKIVVPLHGVNKLSKFIEFDATMVNFPIGVVIPAFLTVVQNGTKVNSKSIEVRMPAPKMMFEPSFTKSIVGTIRIPLSVFGIDPNLINKQSSMTLDVQSAGASTGDIAISAFSVRAE